MMTFWRDLFIGFLAWSCTIYAEKKLSTALFIEPKNISDWMMVVMFNPLSMIIAISLIFIAIYTPFYIIKKHLFSVTYRRIFPGIERVIHLVLILYGIFLLLLTILKFPWFGSVILGFLILSELSRFIPSRSKKSIVP